MVYNLGIHDYLTGTGFLHAWKEVEAPHGAQEIGSYLQMFLYDEKVCSCKTELMHGLIAAGPSGYIKSVVMMLICPMSPSHTNSRRVATASFAMMLISVIMKSDRSTIQRCSHQKHSTK